MAQLVDSSALGGTGWGQSLGCMHGLDWKIQGFAHTSYAPVLLPGFLYMDSLGFLKAQCSQGLGLLIWQLASRKEEIGAANSIKVWVWRT